MGLYRWSALLRHVVLRIYGYMYNYDKDSTMNDRPVHQLWPLSESKQRTELDVVLFHGLQLTEKDRNDAWSSTWTQRSHDDVCWPQEWLPSGLDKPVRIFSVSYNAHVVTSPHDHVSEIAHNLFQSLMDPRYEWHHPIVLIGHSFGGLVLKSLVVELKRASTIRNPTDPWSKATAQRAKVFLRNVIGVAFYAVPHAGFHTFGTCVKKLLRCNNRHLPGIMDNIRPWQRDMEQLSVNFDCIVTENEINIYAFCEGRKMEEVGILVDCTSARRSAGDNFYLVDDADHMEVCKPPSKEHPSYELLLHWIIEILRVARECDQTLQEVHDLPPMFGLESCVERVETLVTSEGSDAAPRYVGVSGMGGVGKTLLLQRLYGSAKVHGHFQGAEFIWLTVGQTPDIMALYRTLSKKLHLDPELHANLEDYKLKLHSHFRQKRVFLVLDDVWQEEAFDSLVLAKGKGSVTLLSTRNKSLLERGSPHISQVQMIPLSKKDSWSLFCVHAFGAASGVPSELKALAQSVAEECQGLPLALKVIGGTMFRKASCEWKEVLKKLRESRLQERNVEKQLYERLKLGYGLLSEDDRRLKDCFLCFSAFPEDHMIDFHEILRLWMGEGLVSGNGGDDARVDAFSLLKKLWKRSFIELEEWDVTRWDDGNLFDEEGFLVFKIHDVMRDLAFYILKNDSDSPPAKQLYLHGAGQNLEEIPHDWKVIPEALRLSLKSNKLKTLPGSFCAPKLLSLLLGGNPIQSVPESFLSNFPKLRVLNLTHGRFDILPDKLGDLKDLVCLDLSHCEMLEQLPETVVELHKLKYLILRGCYELKYLPSGVAKLTSLQVLHTTKCYSLTWAEHTLSGMGESSGHADATIRTSLKDICELVFLTQLSICGERDGVFQLDKPLKMLPCFKQLQELDFSDFCRLEYLPDSFTYPGAFPALIKLGISWCALVRFPEVREGALPELQKLDFTGCYSLKDLPLSLEFLTNLRQLIVSECNDTVKSFCRRYCKISEAWRKFEIKDEYGSLRSWIEDEYESLRR